jgi:hypothetical protein
MWQTQRSKDEWSADEEMNRNSMFRSPEQIEIDQKYAIQTLNNWIPIAEKIIELELREARTRRAHAQMVEQLKTKIAAFAKFRTCWTERGIWSQQKDQEAQQEHDGIVGMLGKCRTAHAAALRIIGECSSERVGLRRQLPNLSGAFEDFRLDSANEVKQRVLDLEDEMKSAELEVYNECKRESRKNAGRGFGTIRNADRIINESTEVVELVVVSWSQNWNNTEVYNAAKPERDRVKWLLYSIERNSI